MAAMRGIVPNLYLFGPQRGDEASVVREGGLGRPEEFRRVLTWADVRRALA